MTTSLITRTDLVADLSFDRTVDRSLVHRSALAEVFVTDSRRLSEERYAAGAQLPLWHPYYSDHTYQPAVFDPVLLLECCRQAGTHGAHAHLDIPTDTAFFVRRWSIQLDTPGAARCGPQPGELQLLTTVEVRRVRTGHTRGIKFWFDLVLDAAPVGSAYIEVGCAGPEQYRAVRMSQRGTEPPLTSQLPDPRCGEEIPAHRVGRRNQSNVLVTAPRIAQDSIAAAFTPLLSHRSLFDHAYDHLPAMVLQEGARQLALLLADQTRPGRAGPLYPVRVAGEFTRFAELDGPVEATAHGAEPTAGTATDSCEVVFRQGEQPIAYATVELAEAGSRPRPPGGLR
jgi:hypothetical protein